MDRLLVEATGGGKRRRCVACGYEDALDGAASPEPRTRLDRTAASDTAEPVRIVGGPPSKPDRSSD
jgi:hypothetical protein